MSVDFVSRIVGMIVFMLLSGRLGGQAPGHDGRGFAGYFGVGGEGRRHRVEGREGDGGAQSAEQHPAI